MLNGVLRATINHFHSLSVLTGSNSTSNSRHYLIIVADVA